MTLGSWQLTRILGWRQTFLWSVCATCTLCVFLCTLCLEPKIVGVAYVVTPLKLWSQAWWLRVSFLVRCFLYFRLYFGHHHQDDISRLWGSWSSQSIACHLDHVELSWHHFTLSGWFLWPPSSGFCRSCQEILEETHPQSSLKRTPSTQEKRKNNMRQYMSQGRSAPYFGDGSSHV